MRPVFLLLASLGPLTLGCMDMDPTREGDDGCAPSESGGYDRMRSGGCGYEGCRDGVITTCSYGAGYECAAAPPRACDDGSCRRDYLCPEDCGGLPVPNCGRFGTDLHCAPAHGSVTCQAGEGACDEGLEPGCDDPPEECPAADPPAHGDPARRMVWPAPTSTSTAARAATSRASA